jgi:hypothetical protein
LLADYLQSGIDGDFLLKWANCTDTRMARNRQQVMATFPVLVPAIVLHGGHPRYSWLAAIVDRGDPLVKAISHIFGVSKSVVRYLIGKPLILIGTGWLGQERNLLHALSLLPPTAFPVTQNDWALMHRFYDTLDVYEGRPSEYVFADLCRAGYLKSQARMLTLCAGELSRLRLLNDYFVFVENWAFAVADKHREESERRAGRSNEFLKQIDVDVFAILEVVKNFVSRWSSPELYRQLLCWQDVSRRAWQEKLTTEEINIVSQWPALLPEPLYLGDHVVVSLGSSDALEEEGHQMRHCISRYARVCAMGESHILSIRSLTGERLSTAEVRLEIGDLGEVSPRLVEHRARGNGQPDASCAETLKNVMQWLANEAQQPMLTDLCRYHMDRFEQVAETIDRCDDPRSEKGMIESMKTIMRNYGSAEEWLLKILGIKAG